MRQRLLAPARAFVVACLLACGTASASDAIVPHPLEDFLRRDSFQELRLSPGGTYYAAKVTDEERTILVFLRRADLAVTGAFRMPGNAHVADFWWVSDERVVLSVEERFGALAQPQPTGELYATNADGSRQELLIGFRAGGQSVGTRIKTREAERLSAYVIDRLPGDERNVLVAVWPWNSDEPWTRVERMDVYNGRRTVVARAPMRRAHFVTDPTGTVRFAMGETTENRTQTWYRPDQDSDWDLFNDQAKTKLSVFPLGFSADGGTAYLQAEQPSGPDRIVAFDVATGERRDVLQSESVDPLVALRDPVTRAVIGALFMEGKPVARFFDPKEAASRRYRSLQASFGDSLLMIDSATSDGRLMLLAIGSDRNPGDYYLFDTVEKRAAHVISGRRWIDPQRTAAVRPVALEARDGVPLHGYLTLPPGSDGKGLPLVVNVHGGPFGILDAWGFDEESQLLAAHGLAVLQVNFRGSGGYGASFEGAGHRQWGRAMQDDVTDATRWAVEQGIADPQRICIIGASYGAYAALMGVAREPELYRCAAGTVGVYDLPMMHGRGDIQKVRWGENFLDEVLGTEGLEETSPTRLADRIKVPVFLAAGERDERAPPEHTRAMQRALEAAGGTVEAHYYTAEGHGFYRDENREKHYRGLVAFLQRHLRPEAATASAAAASAPEASAD